MENGMPVRRRGKGRSAQYLEYLKTTDVVPTDDNLARLWGVPFETAKSARRRAKEDGYIFEALPNGAGWKVVKRPAPPVPQPQLIPPAKNTAPIAIAPEPAAANMADVLRQEFARQNIAINELAQMVAESVQLQRELLEVVKKAWL